MRAHLAPVVLVLLAGCSSEPPRPAAPPPQTAAASAPQAASAFAYPPARRGNVVEKHHGVDVADPYRWLEDMESPETRAWVAAENRQTDAWLAGVRGRAALKTRLAALFAYESFRPPHHHGGHYFWLHDDGRHSQPLVETAGSPDGAVTTLLDPNQISTDGSQALGGLSFTHDGKRFAYGLSAGGGDWHTWRLRDVQGGADLPDKLEHIKYYQPVFTRDGKGIYYSRFPAPPPGKELTETDHDCKVYFHQLGTPASSDVVVYERPDHPTWQYDLQITQDGRYLIISIGDGQVGDRGQEQVAYLDLATPRARPTLLIDAFEAEYLFAGSEGTQLYFKTTAEADNKRVIAIDLRAPAKSKWRTIVPAGPQAIDDVQMSGGQLFVTTMKDAHSAVTAYDLSGRKLREVALPGLGTAEGFRGERGDRETFYAFQSITIPPTVYRYDLATGKSTPWRTPKLAFDPDALETKQIFFPSKDGTKVPMFVVAKKGLVLDGSHPTVITGYGFGGIPYLPYFDPGFIGWVERGGVFAIANIRGGGEYGEAWHLAAKRTHRQTGLDDFIASGEWLIANHYTSPAHLGAIGTSGGGMLVGAVTVQRPDLFGATVPIAGVLDLLRFQLFGQGAGWQGDMGSPDEPTDFASLYKISPLHNVHAGTKYPAIFVVTSDHDVRVAPLHSYKMAAALQAAQQGPGRILLRVQTESGHGGGSTLEQHVEQYTEILGFLAQNLGLPLQ